MRENKLADLYVTDANNDSSPINPTEIETDRLAGADILGKVILFAKDKSPLSEEFSFEVGTNGPRNFYIAGIGDGSWQTVCDGEPTSIVSVSKEEGILTFSARAEKITLIPV